MVVELALAATIPGMLVACYQGVQVMRPRLGYGSDRAGRRTPWILGGVAVLGAGGVMAAKATAWMATDFVAGVALAVVAFVTIGLGIGSAGTSLFALLAQRVDAAKRPAAATIVWVMMMGGFALTATVAGHLLDPFSVARLVSVMTGIACCAFVLAAVALWNVEGRVEPAGVMTGMIAVALAGSALRRRFSLRATIVAGCLVASMAVAALAAAPSVGAAQAIAFAIGGFAGTVAVDVVRWAVGAPVLAYSAVFATEAMVFVVSAALALGAVHRAPAAPATSPL